MVLDRERIPNYFRQHFFIEANHDFLESQNNISCLDYVFSEPDRGIRNQFINKGDD